MRIIVIVALGIFIATSAEATSLGIVQAGQCQGASVSGVFTTGGACAEPITGVTAGDTLWACITEYSGLAAPSTQPVVTETQQSATVHSRTWMTQYGFQPVIGVNLVDIVNAPSGNLTLSSHMQGALLNSAAPQTIIWAELGGVVAAPFDQLGININSSNGGTATTTLPGATTAGTLADVVELAVECGMTNNNEASFGSPLSGWTVPTNGTVTTVPAGVIASFVTNSTAAVVGTTFAPMTRASYTDTGIDTFIAVNQTPQPTATATATATATPTATSTGATATPTASATATCSPSATGTPSPTATPTACPLPVAITTAISTSIPTPGGTPTTSITFTYPEAITLGHLLTYNAALAGPPGSTFSVSDNVNGNWSSPGRCPGPNGDIEDSIYHFLNSAAATAGSLTVTVNFSAPVNGNLTFLDVSGVAGLDTTGTCVPGNGTTISTGPLTSIHAGTFVWGGIAQVGSNTLGSITPSNPTFSTTGAGSGPFSLPLYVLNNQFYLAQASATVTGSAQNYAGLLISYLSCPAGNTSNPPAY